MLPFPSRFLSSALLSDVPGLNRFTLLFLPYLSCVLRSRSRSRSGMDVYVDVDVDVV